MEDKKVTIDIDKAVTETKAKILAVLNESNLPLSVMGLIVELFHTSIQNQLNQQSKTHLGE